MNRIIIILLVLVCLSCEKDEPDYVMEFVGVYTAKRVNSPNSFPLLIDKVDNNTILIEAEWYGEDRQIKANLDKFNFSIPAQDYGNDLISGNGYLRDNTIVINYKLDREYNEHKIIGSK